MDCILLGDQIFFFPRSEETGKGNKQLFHTDEYFKVINNCEVYCALKQCFEK